MPMGEVQRAGLESLAVAERWVEALTSPRFFLFFHIYEPHTPYTPPARFAQYAPYDGEIAYSDEIVGRLIEFLKARGLYDRALIVFLSDHGEGLGDHGEQEHGLFLYDETIRVPLIVKLPGQAARGRRVQQPVQHLDLVPTILDLVGARRPKACAAGRCAPSSNQPRGNCRNRASTRKRSTRATTSAGASWSRSPTRGTASSRRPARSCTTCRRTRGRNATSSPNISRRHRRCARASRT